MSRDRVNPIIGIFEIALFMKSGFNYFNNDISRMWHSFWVLIPTLIFILLTLPYMQNSQYGWGDDVSMQLIYIMFALKFIIGLMASLAFSFYFCKLIHRSHNFVRFVMTSNWFTLVPILLFIPFYVMMQSDFKSYDELYPIFTVISVYSYIMLAYISRYVIDIPWELAVFFTVCFIAINEFGFSLIALVTG